MIRRAALILPALLVACSVITHAYDYQVGSEPTLQPDAAVEPSCGACIVHPEFLRAPCSAEGGAADDAGATRYYAITGPVRLGARSAEWSDPTYPVGVNLDCVARDGGHPAACRQAASAPPIPDLPRGIENAFATQVLARLQTQADADIETDVNAWLSAGHGGFAVQIDDWNGTSDDPHVVVRVFDLIPPATLAGNLPNPTSNSASIAGGQLIAEFGESSVTVALGNERGALVRAFLYGLRVLAKLDAATMTNVVIAGYLGSAGQLGGDFLKSLAELTFGCGTSKDLQSVIDESYDMASPGSGVCNRVSFGLFAAQATALTATNGPIDESARRSCVVTDASTD